MSSGPDDETLAAALRELFEHADPVPGHVRAAGKAVLGWRRLDADLAELLSDSALGSDALAGIRSGPGQIRHVSFSAPGLELHVQILTEAGRARLTGQLSPPAAATIQAQLDDGSVAATAETDELGRFRLELPAGAPTRLRATTPGGVVETSWLRL